MGFINDTSGTITSTETVELDCEGMSTVTVIVSGTWTGLVQFEMEIEGGAGFIPASGFNTDLGDGILYAAATENGTFSIPCAGFELFRVRGASVATGTASINISSIESSNQIYGIQGTVYSESNIRDGSGTPITSTGGALDVNIASGSISLPSGASTSALQTTGNTSLSNIDTKTPALGQTTMAGSTPVTIASNQSAVPISGTVTANAGTGNFTVTQATGTNLHTVVDSGTVTTVSTVTNLSQMSGQAISMGTGVRDAGTQRVTIATNDSVPVTLAANQSVNNAQVVGTAISVNNGTADAGTQRVVIASNNTAFSVNATGPTLTKGTQGATGFSVQNLKDAGRTKLTYYAVNAASGTTGTETAITLTRSSGTAATSTGTSFTPTNGKTFRIEALVFATRGNTTATAQATTFNFRINTAGAVTTTSTPIILSVRCATPATALAYDRYIVPIPDGLEIAGDGTLQFGITAAATFVTNAPTWDVTIIGFEY